MFAPIHMALSVFVPRVRDEAAIVAQADVLEETYGGEAIGHIRNQIAQAARAERARLYRVHDQLARRRSDWAEGAAA